jgi:Cu/Ag efflux pump CusA
LAARDIKKVDRQLKTLFNDRFAGFFFEPMPFLTERIRETLSGSQAAVAVKIYGDDLAMLDRSAQKIARVLNGIPGTDGQPAAVNVLVEPQLGTPEVVIRPRLEDAGRFGRNQLHILDAVHAAYQGADAGQTHKGNRIIDIVVILNPRVRSKPEEIANLWIAVPVDAKPSRAKAEGTEAAPVTQAPDPGRGRVQLKQVADVFLADGRFLVAHEGGIRRQAVTCNVGKNLDVGSFVREAERRLGKLQLPSGVTYQFTGEHEARQTALRELWFWSLIAGTGILLLLAMVFRSPWHLLLLLVNLPFALVGGVAAVYLRGGILDVGSVIGFVTLFGISTRNAIMMISHWRHLHDMDGMPWSPELVFRGARERLAPVLMTALVTGLGLLPIALGSGEAGREIEGPMAQVILGGLVTSTGLNLLALPVLFRRFGM